MSTAPGLALMLFLVVCAALLLLPFYPAWSEWRRPTDRQALRLSTGDDSQASLARLLRQQIALLVGSGQPLVTGSLEQALRDAALSEPTDSNLPPSNKEADAGAPLTLAAGSCFQQIDSPEIVFGQPATLPDPGANHGHETLPVHPHLEGAKRWGANGWRVAGDCVIQEGQHFTGSLVVTGVLSIGQGARVDGDVKAHQGVVVHERAQVNGSVISDVAVRVFDHAAIGGPLLAATLLHIGSSVRLGSRQAPTSVGAADILIGDGTVVYGSVRATQIGLVWSPA